MNDVTMETEEYYRGRVCVVTGAASGIGFAITEGLLQAGAIVYLADRNDEWLRSAVEQLRAYSGRAHSATVDVTDYEQLTQLIQDAASTQGRLDFLFNNAGIGGTLPIGKATLEQWRRMINLNLWGVVYGIHAALPLMRLQRSGHIVTTSSIAGLIPFPYQSLYSTTKAAVVALSECLRYELFDEGIHFSVACPGPVASRIWGTPIVGEYAETKAPSDAIPAVDAARTILAKVANKEGIITLPEETRYAWNLYRSSPGTAERMLLDMARQRREAFEANNAEKLYSFDLELRTHAKSS